LAEWLGKEINRSEFFKLLAPVHLNGICFTFKVDKNTVSLNIIKEYLNMLKENGDVFLTPTVYQGIPAIRISIANWRTTQKDVEIAWQAMQEEIGEYI
jgi:glutamate/tyrosine decarboxylase-like PLP-dependent enzyme